MGILTKENIVNADSLKYLTVPAPKWGGDVILREMTAFARETLREEMGITGEVSTKNLAGKVLVRCIVGEDHQLIFTEQEDELVAQNDQETLQDLFTKALELNKMDVVQEELEKKPEPGQDADLPSDSV